MPFRVDSLASLARQMGFAPTAKRLAQLSAAEDLLLRVEADKAYPIGYVVHAITGYRPRDADVEDADLLPGEALQHDLGLLIESVSDAMDLPAADLGEPVLAIEDVCDRFGVTSKTIQRWRRRGLPARRLLLDDDRKRIAFRLSCVERFIARQEGSAQRPAGIEPLGPREQAECVRRARLLRAAGHGRNEIIHRVARRLGRSSLAILHTLEHHDRLNPAGVVLAGAAEPVGHSETANMLALGEQGLSLGQIARRLRRSRVVVYRALVESRAEKLAAAPVRFHDDPLYHATDSRGRSSVDELVRQAEQALPDRSEEPTRIPRGLPPYLADLYRTPLLTAALERALFLAFNFHKCRFAELRSRLDPHLCRRRDLDALERHLRLAREAKNRIVTANLRLVVSVARKHLRPGLDLMELVSDGNIVLMRAVEGFDVNRGFRFSTYATLALMKGFARSVPQMQAEMSRTSPTAVSNLAERDDGLRLATERDQLNALLARLDEAERQIVTAHYGVGERPEGATLELLSQSLGVTKHRIRQIEQAALEKLRGFVAVE